MSSSHSTQTTNFVLGFVLCLIEVIANIAHFPNWHSLIYFVL